MDWPIKGLGHASWSELYWNVARWEILVTMPLLGYPEADRIYVRSAGDVPPADRRPLRKWANANATTTRVARGYGATSFLTAAAQYFGLLRDAIRYREHAANFRDMTESEPTRTFGTN